MMHCANKIMRAPTYLNFGAIRTDWPAYNIVQATTHVYEVMKNLNYYMLPIQLSLLFESIL